MQTFIYIHMYSYCVICKYWKRNLYLMASIFLTSININAVRCAMYSRVHVLVRLGVFRWTWFAYYLSIKGNTIRDSCTIIVIPTVFLCCCSFLPSFYNFHCKLLCAECRVLYFFFRCADFCCFLFALSLSLAPCAWMNAHCITHIRNHKKHTPFSEARLERALREKSPLWISMTAQSVAIYTRKTVDFSLTFVDFTTQTFCENPYKFLDVTRRLRKMEKL